VSTTSLASEYSAGFSGASKSFQTIDLNYSRGLRVERTRSRSPSWFKNGCHRKPNPIPPFEPTKKPDNVIDWGDVVRRSARLESVMRCQVRREARTTAGDRAFVSRVSCDDQAATR
jgi:hypothetical protein